MPMEVRVEKLFKERDVAYAIPVNTVGVAGVGLAKAIRDKSSYWFKTYRDACLSKEILTVGYHLCSTPTSTLVSIPTKYHYSEDSDLDLIIKSLLAFDRDYDCTFGFHWIDTLRCPALGCGLGKLKWLDIEPKLREALKDTKVNFIFCIEEWRLKE